MVAHVHLRAKTGENSSPRVPNVRVGSTAAFNGNSIEKPIPDDRLVAKEGVLERTLAMVTRLLLPLSPPDLLDLPDR
jgi:hypothetical protein